jgi:hypothetical protein
MGPPVSICRTHSNGNRLTTDSVRATITDTVEKNTLVRMVRPRVYCSETVIFYGVKNNGEYSR